MRQRCVILPKCQFTRESDQSALYGCVFFSAMSCVHVIRATTRVLLLFFYVFSCFETYILFVFCCIFYFLFFIFLGVECDFASDPTLHKCWDNNGEFELAPDENCTFAEWVCDDIADCPFGDDEWNCPNYTACVTGTETNGDPSGFACDDSTCIPYEWSCLGGDFNIWDCPNQEDISQETCEQNSEYTDCEGDDNYFKCTNTNGRCIEIFRVCDENEDCLDGQDETDEACNITPAPTQSPTEDINIILEGSMTRTAGGDPNYQTTIEIQVDTIVNEVTLNMTGPAAWYYGFGFDSTKMLDNTYAIIVDENGNVFEYLLEEHARGSDITQSITVESERIFTNPDDELVYRNVVVKRGLNGDVEHEYDFPMTTNTNISMIWAQGGSFTGLGVAWNASFAWHGALYRGSGWIFLEQVETSMCSLCFYSNPFLFSFFLIFMDVFCFSVFCFLFLVTFVFLTPWFCFLSVIFHAVVPFFVSFCVFLSCFSDPFFLAL